MAGPRVVKLGPHERPMVLYVTCGPARRLFHGPREMAKTYASKGDAARDLLNALLADIGRWQTRAGGDMLATVDGILEPAHCFDLDDCDDNPVYAMDLLAQNGCGFVQTASSIYETSCGVLVMEVAEEG